MTIYIRTSVTEKVDEDVQKQQTVRHLQQRLSRGSNLRMDEILFTSARVGAARVVASVPLGAACLRSTRLRKRRSSPVRRSPLSGGGARRGRLSRRAAAASCLTWHLRVRRWSRVAAATPGSPELSQRSRSWHAARPRTEVKLGAS